MIPGMGGFELVVIALFALVIVGPKDLPVLLRQLGKFTGKVRGMAQEFRASFDEMARQSELDELRKEVEALRSQSIARPLGPELEDHFREIGANLEDLPVPSPDPVPEVSISDTPAAEAAAEPEKPKRKRAPKKPAAEASEAAAPEAPKPEAEA
jgi:sec-independent protein translocase protein TatB